MRAVPWILLSFQSCNDAGKKPGQLDDVYFHYASLLAAANTPYSHIHKSGRQHQPPDLCRQYQRQNDYYARAYRGTAPFPVSPEHKNHLPHSLSIVFSTAYAKGGNIITVNSLVVLALPELVLGAELIKPLIGSVAAWHYLTTGESLSDGAARLFQMGAVIEAASTDIWGKLDKIILKLLLGDGLHHFDLKGGEAGGICRVCILSQ